MNNATRYDLIDIQTGIVVKSFPTKKAARSAADRKDAAYGAIRYIVKPIWA